MSIVLSYIVILQLCLVLVFACVCVCVQEIRRLQNQRPGHKLSILFMSCGHVTKSCHRRRDSTMLHVSVNRSQT